MGYHFRSDTSAIVAGSRISALWIMPSVHGEQQRMLPRDNGELVRSLRSVHLVRTTTKCPARILAAVRWFAKFIFSIGCPHQVGAVHVRVQISVSCGLHTAARARSASMFQKLVVSQHPSLRESHSSFHRQQSICSAYAIA